MSGMNRASIGRRRFVQLMGWAGAAAIAHGGPAVAASARRPKASGRPEPSPSPKGEPVPEVSEEARALAELVKRRHGQHLSPEELATVTRDLDGDLKGLERLRATKLSNGDEPDVTFRA
jgi:hypothetical protein